MQNMVWSYCKKISPEWKLQVSIVSLQRSGHALCDLLAVLCVVSFLFVTAGESG